MKWILQITVMLSDFIIAGACVLALYGLPLLLAIPLVYITYKVWKGNGGLIAWTHDGRKQFFDNASKYGL